MIFEKENFGKCWEWIFDCSGLRNEWEMRKLNDCLYIMVLGRNIRKRRRVNRFREVYRS